MPPWTHVQVKGGQDAKLGFLIHGTPGRALKRLVSKRIQVLPGILTLIQTTWLTVTRQIFTASCGTSGKDRPRV